MYLKLCISGTVVFVFSFFSPLFLSLISLNLAQFGFLSLSRRLKYCVVYCNSVHQRQRGGGVVCREREARDK